MSALIIDIPAGAILGMSAFTVDGNAIANIELESAYGGHPRLTITLWNDTVLEIATPSDDLLKALGGWRGQS